MAKIAIIGTPGAGKTTFLSVLAMRYRSQQPGKPWLSYLKGATQRYVAEGWDTLQNMDWPDPTPPGLYPQLAWELHAPDDQTHQISVRDPAGQDILAIYESPHESLNDPQKDLKAVITEADAVLFLVNLREVIDAGSQRQIDQVEITLCMAIQDILTRTTRVALVLTQHDSYTDFLEAENSAFGNPSEALRHYLPQVGGRLINNSDRVRVFYVAAVAETVPVTDPNGKTYRRPKRGFASEGMVEVMDWVCEVAGIERSERIKKENEQAQESLADSATQERKCVEAKIIDLRTRLKTSKEMMGGAAGLGFVCLLIFSQINPSGNEGLMNSIRHWTAVVFLLAFIGSALIFVLSIFSIAIESKELNEVLPIV